MTDSLFFKHLSWRQLDLNFKALNTTMTWMGENLHRQSHLVSKKQVQWVHLLMQHEKDVTTLNLTVLHNSRNYLQNNQDQASPAHQLEPSIPIL